MARPRLLLLVVLVITACAALLGGGVADRLSSGGSQIPGAESTYTTRVLEQRRPASQPNLLLMVSARGAKDGVDDPQVAAEARDLARRLGAEQVVGGVVSYRDGREPALRARDSGEALITARIAGDEDAVDAVLERVRPSYEGRRGPVDVRFGGPAAVRNASQEVIAEDLVRAGMIALPVTLVLLVFVFGSAVAALLPLLVGIMAILGTNAVLRVLTSSPMSPSTPRTSPRPSASDWPSTTPCSSCAATARSRRRVLVPTRPWPPHCAPPGGRSSSRR